MKKKLLSVALATIIAVMAISGASLAWLQDTTGTVTNTFTEGKVDIDLYETKDSQKVMENSYKMVPGDKLTKDPTVTVKAISEACWLFVKVQEINDVDTFLTYAIADGWTVLSGKDTAEMIIYREVSDTDADQTFTVLKDNQVTVKETVKMSDMETLATAGNPQLKFTAYAVQKANVATAEAAWSIINSANP